MNARSPKVAGFLVMILGVLLVGLVAHAQQPVLGFSVSTLANPFFLLMKQAGEEEAARLGLRLITLDAQDNVQKQIQDIEDLIARRVRVLLINPVDSNAVGPAVLEANRAGIPVITLTRPSAAGVVAQHLSVDNVFGGKLIAAALIAELNGVGDVVILEGSPGAPSARDRQAGFLEVVRAFPTIRILASVTANYSREQGVRVMEDLLQAHPKIDAVYAHNDEMALGAIRAIEAAGRQGIKVFGFDATPDALTAIRDGKMVATIRQQPDLQMKLAVRAAFDLIQGRSVEPQVRIPVVVVNRWNLER